MQTITFHFLIGKKTLFHNNVLLKEADKLKQQLEVKGLMMNIADAVDKDEPKIELKLVTEYKLSYLLSGA